MEHAAGGQHVSLRLAALILELVTVHAQHLHSLDTGVDHRLGDLDARLAEKTTGLLGKANADQRLGVIIGALQGKIPVGKQDNFVKSCGHVA